jgi:hypothetical protein
LPQIDLSPPQSKAHRALGRLLGIERRQTVTIPWGRGVGKSWFDRLICYLAVSRWDGKLIPGAKHPGIRIAFVMPTLTQAKKVHLKLLRLEMAGEWAHLGGQLNAQDWVINFPGGSWIQWVYADQAANRGLRCDLVIVDECDDVDPEFYTSVTLPWFSEPHSLGLSLLSGTPRRGRYGLLYGQHRLALDKHPRHFSFHATYKDVPQYVDMDAVEAAKPPKTPPAIFAREWLCDFDSAEGLVYSLFSERVHVQPTPADRKWTEVIIGVDHGYEDPGCFIVIGVLGSGKDAVLHVIAEIYQRHKTETWWCNAAKDLLKELSDNNYPTPKWWADPSQPARIKALKNAGCRIEGAENDIEDGVSSVADRLIMRLTDDGTRYTKLFVDPKCRNTISEFGMYRRKRDPRNTERVLDDIEDKNNHAMDALRYAVFNRFGVPGKSKATRSDSEFGWS